MMLDGRPYSREEGFYASVLSSALSLHFLLGPQLGTLGFQTLSTINPSHPTCPVANRGRTVSSSRPPSEDHSHSPSFHTGVLYQFGRFSPSPIIPFKCLFWKYSLKPIEKDQKKNTYLLVCDLSLLSSLSHSFMNVSIFLTPAPCNVI